jgi:hypothetical protein
MILLGAIQLSWNYNYIDASVALTGTKDTFCQNPELVATDPLCKYSSQARETANNKTDIADVLHLYLCP